MRDVSRVLFVLLLLVGLYPAQSQTTPAPPSTVLFENVRIFDGKSRALSAPTNVLVKGNIIQKISTTPIPTDRMATTKLIQGDGRTLMPGLIDAHTHIMMASLPLQVAMTADIGYLNLLAAKEAELR